MDYLKSVTIKNPCPANWDEMVGDDQARFCNLCKLNVYNFSEMTREQANNLIAEKEGKLCGQYFQREDGTILTKDCSVVRASRARRYAAAAIVLALLFSLQGIAALSGRDRDNYRSDFVKLRRSYVYQFKPVQASVDWAEKTLVPPQSIGAMVAGRICVQPPPANPNPPAGQ